MANYEVRLFKPAQDFLRGLEREDREYVGGLLDNLETDPTVDGRDKVTVMIPPVALLCYTNARFWILYHIVDNTSVRVLNIDIADQQVTPWRSGS